MWLIWVAQTPPVRLSGKFQTSEGLNDTQGSVSGVLNQLTGIHGTLKSSNNIGANFPQ